LERLNWAADSSAKGLAQSAGLMVNYLYELGKVEGRHEDFVNAKLSVSHAVRKLL
jgi:malonyl-CoA decarboxylase